MSTFAAETRRYVQLTLYVLALYVVGWGFTPYSSFFASLVLGAVIGLFNMWSMYRDVKKIGDAAEKQKKAFTIGLLARLATGALIAALFLQFPEHFHLAGLVTGIMTPYIIILLHSLFKKKTT
ncbi:ATP synthase subunit I [Salibacterium aidingense]|uniref:ATP synthase subunit I n=1 Tax=Salibacterium aidingense TaxID=384933 RepID=UPI0003F592C7|nr:ATP synthase subunit I [Salibacterium aidingense]